MDYKGVYLMCNQEEWRINRLKKIVDEILSTIPKEERILLEGIEDIKGEIKTFWREKITLMSKKLVEIICYDDNDACDAKLYVNHLNTICGCNQKPQKEDDEIKKYIKSLTI